VHVRSGHRLLPHTADLIVEAWAPTRELCLREAVRGLVEAFADVRGVAAGGAIPIALPPDDDSSLLLGLLDEVLYLLDADDVVPVDVAIERTADGGLRGAFLVASTAAVAQQGAVPKAIAHHGLHLGHDAVGWRCRVTVDV
jgi:SHS2 domain-containing protein